MSAESTGVIQVTEVLRDRLWDHLPRVAPFKENGIGAGFEPSVEEDIRMNIEYEPVTDYLSVNTVETLGIFEIGDSNEYLAAKYYKQLEIAAKTGEVISYFEAIDVADADGRSVPLPEECDYIVPEVETSDEEEKRRARDEALDYLEHSVFYTFTQEKQNFFLGLLDAN
jgi:hypothetical protein